jgi:hypothetical protein
MLPWLSILSSISIGIIHTKVTQTGEQFLVWGAGIRRRHEAQAYAGNTIVGVLHSSLKTKRESMTLAGVFQR